MKVSLANMKIALWNARSPWRVWVYADSTGGHVSYWNGRKHPNQ